MLINHPKHNEEKLATDPHIDMELQEDIDVNIGA